MSFDNASSGVGINQSGNLVVIQWKVLVQQVR